jgi:cell wall-associated NlpC family hydrolase
MTSEEITLQRQAVIAEARTWIGTPFHHAACVKGAGVDCVYMPAASYNKAIGVGIVIPTYSPQWHLHQTGPDGKHEELYLDNLKSSGFVELSDMDPEFEPYDASNWIAAPKYAGDLVVVKLARTYAHSAIIVDWPSIIQAESSPAGRGMVAQGLATVNWFFTARPVKFYSRKEWHGSIV